MKSSAKPTNVSLDSLLVAEAKELGINISKACETGLAMQVSEVKALRWQEENREAIECYNEFVAQHGILLSEHRMF